MKMQKYVDGTITAFKFLILLFGAIAYMDWLNSKTDNWVLLIIGRIAIASAMGILMFKFVYSRQRFD
jgi:hypothetical protein